ncbi:uncharacterized protein RHO25_007501 [Cercospora beticola]|uniref:Uncharacterized protein n=1 Tax=Cercospora beticola TaxID=122368 RepID=A0ABZ0NTW6_CERBT|nr:hypothetical protein RHO25_007501 [Cercospora beticola]
MIDLAIRSNPGSNFNPGPGFRQAHEGIIGGSNHGRPIDAHLLPMLSGTSKNTAMQGPQNTTPSEDLVASCSLSAKREQKGDGPINNRPVVPVAWFRDEILAVLPPTEKTIAAALSLLYFYVSNLTLSEITQSDALQLQSAIASASPTAFANSAPAPPTPSPELDAQYLADPNTSRALELSVKDDCSELFDSAANSMYPRIVGVLREYRDIVYYYEDNKKSSKTRCALYS